MNNLVNVDKDKWVRPWNKKKRDFDSISIRDDRFFSILIKGLLQWLNQNVVLYDEPVKHFILQTGSTYLYIEQNGYEFNMSETTGEDMIYHHLPRCVCEINNMNIPFEELTNPFIRGTYERLSSVDKQYKGYNAQMRRLPIEMVFTLRYVFSNFNENLILLEEILNKFTFQKYFNIIYLGQKIQCSIEFPVDLSMNIPKIDFDSTESNQRVMEIQIKVDSYYPVINEDTEIENNKIIGNSRNNMVLTKHNTTTDINIRDTSNV